MYVDLAIYGENNFSKKCASVLFAAGTGDFSLLCGATYVYGTRGSHGCRCNRWVGSAVLETSFAFGS